MTHEKLVKRQYYLLIDKSGSMVITDYPEGKSRWEYAKEIANKVCVKCVEYDQNGITLGLFSTNIILRYNVKQSALEIDNLFSQAKLNGATNTAQFLNDIFTSYFSNKEAGIETKPLTIIIITDGRPESVSDLSRVIVDATHRMNSEDEINIFFFQIGKDIDAASSLLELENSVNQESKFDIISINTTNEIGDLAIDEAIIAELERQSEIKENLTEQSEVQ